MERENLAFRGDLWGGLLLRFQVCIDERCRLDAENVMAFTSVFAFAESLRNHLHQYAFFSKAIVKYYDTILAVLRPLNS
jgi:hypothetical protein